MSSKRRPTEDRPGRNRGGKTSPPGLRERLLERLLEPVDIASLAFFRVAFGAIMIWQTWIYLGKARPEMIDPEFHFTYLGFGWVQPWAGDGVIYHLWAMGLFAALVMTGAWYRVSAVLLFLAHQYIFLLDQSLYQNHYYLVCLVCFLMIWMPANRAFSLDAWRHGPAWHRDTAPAWTIWTLRAQMGFVYFYAGVAKLNWDWLQGYPTRHVLPQLESLPIVGAYATEVWAAIAVAWAGTLLDLFIVPALLWRKTRPLAFTAALVFHVTNKIWFGIGIFPAFSIAMTLLYFEPDWPRRLLRRPRLPETALQGVFPLTGRRRLALGVVGVFMALQVLLPLRHFLYEGNTSWSEEGHRFAWRQKVRGKDGLLRFVLIDPITGRTWDVDPEDHLTPYQWRKMTGRPYMIIQLAHYFADIETRAGRSRPKVLVVSLNSLNGRELQPLIDASVDLATEPRTWFAPYDWIIPLQVPLEAQWDFGGPPRHPTAKALIREHRETFQARVRELQARTRQGTR